MQAEKISRPSGSNFRSEFYTVTWQYEGCTITFQMEVPHDNWLNFHVRIDEADFHLLPELCPALQQALTDLHAGTVHVPLKSGEMITFMYLEHGWVKIVLPDKSEYIVTTQAFLNLEFSRPGDVIPVRMHTREGTKISFTFGHEKDEVVMSQPNEGDPYFLFDRAAFFRMLNVLDKVAKVA